MSQRRSPGAADVLANASATLQQVADVLVTLNATIAGLATQLSPIIQDYHADRHFAPLPHRANHQTATTAEVEHARQIPTPAEVEVRIATLPDTDACYLVSRGREPGIYATNTEALLYVAGVASASMKRMNSKAAALSQYSSLFEKGHIASLL